MAYVAEDASQLLKRLDSDTARVIADQLKSLPDIEDVAGSTLVLPGLPEGYRAVALPSGYLAIYRKLSDAESEGISGGLSPGEDAYLVADLVPLMDDIPRRLMATS